ncbi:MAG: sugar phosphate isomerase/epimerase [Clostridia bacterium]|nr:sugar phosphate isomerase/epimerase [Clostridia bacterium]
MKKYIQCICCQNENTSPEETIYAIKNAGFDGAFVQWYNHPLNFSQEQQLMLCRKLGLDVPFVHLGYDGINNIWLKGKEGRRLVKGYIKDLNDCKANNVSLVIMHLSSKDTAPAPTPRGIKRFKKIIKHARKVGIKIAFENGRKFGYLEYLFKHITSDNIGVCFDAGHYHCFFKDKFNWQLFHDKIIAIHLHDNDGENDLHSLPFDGTMDWKNMTDNLKQTTYNGPITLENKYKGDYVKMPIEDYFKLALKKAKQIDL